ncbi:MAG: di-trans,poly-cis-decaprenylcistransferase [Candidatus Aenigmatarchaeota archaeon]|nr:MAG: di-trans,poly-cis-decaprenylcistransferase [Candidatus Aenigmarchaeota archaeon]
MIQNLPQHIGIIPDGNRRFARRLMKKPWKGHEWGFEKFKEVFEWCKELGIKIITVYSLSLENLSKRPKEELEMLFNIARKEINEILNNKENFIRKYKIKLSFFGNLEVLPNDLQDGIRKVKKLTENNKDYFINIAIAYGGRQEIVRASQKIAADVLKGRLKPEDIDEAILRQNLQTNGFPDPDLIIRTGGEKRISNFLIFQAAYSELAFIDKYWPEITKDEFIQILKDYSQRERRFGR